MTADVQRRQAPRARSRGFTLIEVMITVAIVGILAAVAYPSYMSYIRKGNRADATSLLQAAALAQERVRLGSPKYASAVTALSPPCSASPCKSERQHYTLGIAPTSVADDYKTGFVLTATPTSSFQSKDTDCSPISLTVNGGTTTYGPDKCWGK